MPPDGFVAAPLPLEPFDGAVVALLLSLEPLDGVVVALPLELLDAAWETRYPPSTPPAMRPSAAAAVAPLRLRPASHRGSGLFVLLSITSPLLAR